MTGTWTASDDDFDMSIPLSESDGGSISGSGTFSGAETISLTISGSHAHPDVSLTMTSSGYEDLNFTGEFSGDDRINGSLNRSGFDNYALTLTR